MDTTDVVVVVVVVGDKEESGADTAAVVDCGISDEGALPLQLDIMSHTVAIAKLVTGVAAFIVPTP